MESEVISLLMYLIGRTVRIGTDTPFPVRCFRTWYDGLPHQLSAGREINEMKWFFLMPGAVLYDLDVFFCNFMLKHGKTCGITGSLFRKCSMYGHGSRSGTGVVGSAGSTPPSMS
jgi:hypothetical protein